MNQTKNDFLNSNDIENAYYTVNHTPAPGATPILFHPKLGEAISLQTSKE